MEMSSSAVLISKVSSQFRNTKKEKEKKKKLLFNAFKSCSILYDLMLESICQIPVNVYELAR